MSLIPTHVIYSYTASDINVQLTKLVASPNFTVCKRIDNKNCPYCQCNCGSLKNVRIIFFFTSTIAMTFPQWNINRGFIFTNDNFSLVIWNFCIKSIFWPVPICSVIFCWMLLSAYMYTWRVTSYDVLKYLFDHLRIFFISWIWFDGLKWHEK